MRVAFRVDASERIGTGHMIRCLALCEVLQARGAEVHIISADIPGNMGTVVEARGFRLAEAGLLDGPGLPVLGLGKERCRVLAVAVVYGKVPPNRI